MDAKTRDRLAVRCIVVSTQAGMAKIAREYRADPVTRERLHEATLERGHLLLAELEREHQQGSEMVPLLRAARAALSG